MTAVFFRAKLWRHQGEAGWHFLTAPKPASDSLRSLSTGLRNAFGSVRVKATIGESSWRTSVFFDTKAQAYLLPVKADIRRRERIGAGDLVEVGLEIEL